MRTLLITLLLLASSACMAQGTIVTVPLSGGGSQIIVHDPYDGMRTYTVIPPRSHQPQSVWPPPERRYDGLDPYGSGYDPIFDGGLIGPIDY